jgi:hypothetical protein
MEGIRKRLRSSKNLDPSTINFLQTYKYMSPAEKAAIAEAKFQKKLAKMLAKAKADDYEAQQAADLNNQYRPPDIGGRGAFFVGTTNTTHTYHYPYTHRSIPKTTKIWRARTRTLREK